MSSLLLSPPAAPLMNARDVAVGRGGGGGSGSGSYGPVIAALVVIAVLTAASVAVSKLCVRRFSAPSSSTTVKCGAHGIIVVGVPFLGRWRKRGAAALPLKGEKKGGDIESAAAAAEEEMEGPDAPKAEEEEDGGGAAAPVQ